MRTELPSDGRAAIQSERRGRDLAVLIALLVFPTFAAWIYFDLLSGKKWMLPAYSISKTLQFATPILWVVFVQKTRPQIRQASRRGIGLGVAIGLAIFGLFMAVYFGYFRTSPVLAEAPEKLHEKLVGMGAETLAKFVALALFVSVIHSVMEEYYWRWYAYGQLRRWVRPLPANLISSLAFMGHHIVIINAYIPSEYFWTATMFFSVSVAVGGAIWAWIYERTGSLYGGWMSHMIVDVAIMVTGYDLAFGNA
jgi:membrane protease YdiL (CAAX protease family)